ncbi:[protein-PII] uridylyltransferase [Nocardioides terrae]|uniref:Bifunctional uridylyltransferase/uridylyl-removing enzyme n=1 Tax=Nocardioides terrae TaxID=574651 RepID=A0A1I1J465_9ACTN|nr:[protein-PII] uridylyltransferase [Nocardioides terrae]SFC43294.1 [protein-PII] uridylyltransferase [Nocardioides terrae]
MTAAERAERAAAADLLCVEAYNAASGPLQGAALVAVGGYGRAELAPCSDLDVVLVHDEGVGLGATPSTLWYPLWDSGARLDHSLRSLPEMVSAADDDVRVALGLLDVRHLAGDPNLTLRLRTTMLAHWRRHARQRLSELRRLAHQRHDLLGELAHASVPDVKESAGGLRDATILNALVATWLVDVPHTDLEPRRQDLLDIRDHVQEVAGRATDRIAPEIWPQLAERLALPDERAAQAYVRGTGRRITHISRLTWRRVDAVIERPVGVRPRRPDLTPLEAGVALSGGEVVLDGSVRPADDPLLLLRAAALAAEHDVVLAPPTISRLADDVAPLPVPWPPAARRLFVRLLAAGPGLRAVWETLDETGAVDRLLPEWERVRLLPHASVIHRFTVDRHMVETCIEAAGLIRAVARPDVLAVAALLHDIGKGGPTEHSVAGAPIAREIATRMGFDREAVALIETLVRWHLLLATVATTRDPDDPATVAAITERIAEPAAVDLLAALTEADARATSPKAWSSWRASLILDLARRARVALDPGASPAPLVAEEVTLPPAVRRGVASFAVQPVTDGTRLTVIAPDRVGLLADTAATFAMQRLRVRAARAWSQEDCGVSVWEVDDQHLDPAVLRERFEAISEGRIDPAGRLRPADTSVLAPSVAVRAEASAQATVLEVRATDRPGVVYLVCAALARLGVAVRSAHVDTLGPQAVDVFYLQESHAGVLGDQRAAEAAHAVRAALSGES